jgi:hypothetical protein
MDIGVEQRADSRDVGRLLEALQELGFKQEAGEVVRFSLSETDVADTDFCELHSELSEDGRTVLLVLARTSYEGEQYGKATIFVIRGDSAQEAHVKTMFTEDEQAALIYRDEMVEEWQTVVRQLQERGISTVERERVRLEAVVQRFGLLMSEFAEIRRAQENVDEVELFNELGVKANELKDEMDLLEVPQCSLHVEVTGLAYEELLVETIEACCEAVEALVTARVRYQDSLAGAFHLALQNDQNKWTATRAAIWDGLKMMDRLALQGEAS